MIIAGFSDQRFGFPFDTSDNPLIFDGTYGEDYKNFFFQFVILLPYVVYLGHCQMHPPHDCFECFNRLPGNIKYSIYQYTRVERDNIKHQRTLGKGAIQEFERLYRQLEQEARGSLNKRAPKETLVNSLGFASQEEAERAYYAQK